MLARVTEVRHVRDHVIELTFSDGTRGELDLRDRVLGRGGGFAPLEEVAEFQRVRVDAEAGTIVWPNGVGFCPDVLYSEITGAPLPGQHLAPTAASHADGDQRTK